MIVYIVRHAWAEERDAQRWPDDGLRPLTRAGSKRFRKVAEKLAKRGMRLAAIATSPLVRCRETADLLSSALEDTPVEELDGLAPDSRLLELVAWTKSQAAGDVAWVGHEPDVGRLCAELCGGSGAVGGGAAIRFAKGAVAALQFDSEVARGRGQLLWLVTAEMLGC